jgi:hypothetical protein
MELDLTSPLRRIAHPDTDAANLIAVADTMLLEGTRAHTQARRRQPHSRLAARGG